MFFIIDNLICIGIAPGRSCDSLHGRDILHSDVWWVDATSDKAARE